MKTLTSLPDRDRMNNGNVHRPQTKFVTVGVEQV